MTTTVLPLPGSTSAPALPVRVRSAAAEASATRETASSAQCRRVRRPSADSELGSASGQQAPAHRSTTVRTRSRQVGDRGRLRLLRRPGEDAALEAERLVQRLELAGELLERAPPPADVAVRARQLARGSARAACRGDAPRRSAARAGRLWPRQRETAERAHQRDREQQPARQARREAVARVRLRGADAQDRRARGRPLSRRAWTRTAGQAATSVPPRYAMRRRGKRNVAAAPFGRHGCVEAVEPVDDAHDRDASGPANGSRAGRDGERREASRRPPPTADPRVVRRRTPRSSPRRSRRTAARPATGS